MVIKRKIDTAKLEGEFFGSGNPEPGQSLVNAIRLRIAYLSGIELDLPDREAIRPPPRFNSYKK